MKNRNGAWPYLILAVLIVVADQAVKAWIQQNLALYESAPLLPGIVKLTYVQNTGAAFSMLSAHTWLLGVLSGLVSVVILALLLRRVFPHWMGRLTLGLLLGGAVGNLIDRFVHGYVVDMFQLEFINFAVFNVADIGVTVGGVLLCAYVLFFWKQQGEGKQP